MVDDILRVATEQLDNIQIPTVKMDGVMDILIVIAIFYGMIQIFNWIFDGLENAGIVRYTGPTLNSMGHDDIVDMVRRSQR